MCCLSFFDLRLLITPLVYSNTEQLEVEMVTIYESKQKLC